jgi:C-terminal processing protease CtpA/Prc
MSTVRSFLAAGLLLAAGAFAHEPCSLDAALAAYAAGDYARSADLFERARGCARFEATDHYNAACAEALAGRADAAFASLGRAVALGWANVEHLAADTDLAGLHADPRWERVTTAAGLLAENDRRIWGGAAFETPYRETLPEEERIAGLARYWAEVRSNFAFFDQVPELDWDAAFLETLPKVRAAATTAEYYRVLQALNARLRDGHTNVYPPKELRPSFYTRPALRTARIEGRVVITRLLDPALAGAGLAPGLEILAVDGEPVESYARSRVRPYQAASTPQDLEVRTYDYALLAGTPGSEVELLVEDAAGARRAVRLVRTPQEELAKVAPPFRPFELTPLGDGILRVDLRSFDTPKVVEDWLASWDQIAAAKGLILDLRDNGGGNSGHGYRILSTLIDRASSTTVWRTRLYRPAFRAWGNAEGWHVAEPGSLEPDAAHRFAGPVAVLIGPRTYSAAEDFAVAFDVAERGPMIGEATGGSTGQPLMFALPGGGQARVCSKRDTYPDGREFVGVGVRPDRVVTTTVADLRAGRDPVLDAAVEAVRAAAP